MARRTNGTGATPLGPLRVGVFAHLIRFYRRLPHSAQTYGAVHHGKRVHKPLMLSHTQGKARSSPPMTHTPPPLNEKAYRRYMRLAHRAGQLIGMDLSLAGHPRSLRNGQIFLFNHFTRFETTIPPYMLYHHTGAICRSVAHSGLFDVHRALTRFLWDGGCLPSKMPGLLPYLAAEILRGRKVVIFPEGGLVKDKKVVSANGEFTFQSSGTLAPRKHHRGAAVLALYLDIFKALLRDAQSRHDDAMLAHWQAELNLPTRAALLEAIQQPTLLVPSTITFFPMRHEGNILSKIIEWFIPNLSDTARDELITETNILTHPTELTVHVGAPLESGWAMKAPDLDQWRLLFTHIKTLEAFFEMDLTTTHSSRLATWFKPSLQTQMEGAMERLRNKATRALYGGLTLNIQHVIASVVHHAYHHGRTSMPEAEFNAAVLWAAAKLQQQAATSKILSLHRTIATPEVLHQLALGQHKEANAFLQSLHRVRLVRHKGGVYHFSGLLAEGLMPEEIRLENPIQLHVNEATPTPAVALAAYWATEQAAAAFGKGQTSLPLALWAELQLNIHRNAAHAAYAEAGAAALKAGAGAVAPFLLKPHTQGNATQGVVLLHGLGASPAQMRPLAEDLAAQGYMVYGPTLPGHGGKPADLYHASTHAWLAEARLAVQVLKALGCTQVQVVGFSTGGLIALQLAAEHQPTVSHVVAISPALKLVQKRRHLLPLGLLLNDAVGATVGRLFGRLREGVIPWHTMHPAFPAEQYAKLPLIAVARLVKLGQQVRVLGRRITIPITLVHGTADDTTRFATTQAFAASVPHATLVALQGGHHDGVRENYDHLWAHVSAALAGPHKRQANHADANTQQE